MWWLIFAAWSPMWWILVVAEICLLIWFVEEDWPGKAIFSLLILSALLIFFGDFNVYKYIKANPILLLKYFSMYIVIGVVWGVCKYYFFLTKIRRLYVDSKKKYMKTHSLQDMTSQDLKNWKSGWGMNGEREIFEKDTEFWRNKARIITWMTYWPLSMVWTVISDLVKRVLEEIWEFVKGFFKMMHKKVLGELLSDKAKM